MRYLVLLEVAAGVISAGVPGIGVEGATARNKDATN